MENSSKIITEIEEEVIPKLNEIIRGKSYFPSGWLLHLFSICGNEETVDLIFDKMHLFVDISDGERATINLSYFLGSTTTISKKYFSKIINRLDEMAISDNKKMQTISIELRKGIAQASPFHI